MSMASEQRGDGRSLVDLLGSLASDLPGLFRSEIALAKAEAGEKLTKSLDGIRIVAFGAVLGIGALVVLLGGVVSLLTGMFVSQGMDAYMAGTLASLLVGGVVGVIAYSMALKGLAALSADKLKLERTAASLGRDADIVKERF